MSVDTMESIVSKEHKTSLRKSNKPIMEKRRRARINNCLTQLKSLVLESMRKDSSQYSKLEKADILEMTVKHLRNLQRNQMVSAMASDPTVVTKFRAGYHECANEVMRYLGSMQNIGPDVKKRLVSHLSTCMQSQNVAPQATNGTVPQQQQQHQIQIVSPQSQNGILQPLSVHIPQNVNNISPLQSSDCLLMTSNSRQASPICKSQSPQVVNIAPLMKTTECNNNSPIKPTQFSGQFQIIPGNLYNGPVAVYVGQLNQKQTVAAESVPVFTLQVPNSNGSPNFSNDDFVSNNCNNRQMYESKPFVQGHRSAFVECKNNVNESPESLWRPW